MTDSTMSRSVHREHAVSIVEVVIAVIIIAVVATAVGIAAVSGSNASSQERLRTSLINVAKQAHDDIAGDMRWTASCQSINQECDVTQYVRDETLQLEDIGDDERIDRGDLRAVAIGQDSLVDGQGDQDKDGVIPDFYRISIRISPSQALATRYGTTKELATQKFGTTVDRRGKNQVGSLTVQVCRATNQVDERTLIQTCRPTGVSGVKMLGCPPKPRQNCVTAFEGWVEGIDEVTEDKPSPFVSMKRVTDNQIGDFQLTNGDTTINARGKWNDERKEFEFDDIPAGEYRITGLPAELGADGRRYRRWKTKELPAYHGVGAGDGRITVVVEPGIRSRALVMFRPKRTDAKIDLHFERVTPTRVVTRMGWSSASLASPMKPGKRYFGNAPLHKYCTFLAAVAALYQAFVNATYEPSLWTPARYEPWGCRRMAYGDPSPHCATIYGDFVITTQNILTGQVKYIQNERNKRVFERCVSAEKWAEFYYWKPTRREYPIKRGAAANVDAYRVEPRPDWREMNYPGDDELKPPTTVHPVESCKSKFKEYDCVGGTISKMLPGLQSGIVIDESAQAAADKNEDLPGWVPVQERPMPAWMKKPFWIKPSGEIIDRSGVSRGDSPSATLRGIGECRWKVQGQIFDGSCDPCVPTWLGGKVMPASCSIATKYRTWRRWFAKERRWQPSGEFMGATGPTFWFDSRKDTHDLPPWGCTGGTPRWGQCGPRSGGGGDGGGNNGDNGPGPGGGPPGGGPDMNGGEGAQAVA